MLGMRSRAGDEGRRRATPVGVLATVGALTVATSAVIAISVADLGTAGDTSTIGTPPAASQPVSEDDRDLLYRAEQVLLRTCMAEQGFRYWPMPEQPAPDYRQFSYVVTDVAWAKKHGYGRDIELQIQRESRNSPPVKYSEGLSEQRRQALGVAMSGPEPVGLAVANPIGGTLTHSDKGCTATVWKQLYGDPQAWFAAHAITMNLGAIRADRASSDPAFVAGVDRWRTCMRPLGYTDRDPAALRGRTLSTPGLTRAQEIRAATAEATCATMSDLASIARQVDHRYQLALQDEYRSTFTSMWSMQRAALRLAHSVLAGASDQVR